jgi:hypothetical protein
LPVDVGEKRTLTVQLSFAASEALEQLSETIVNGAARELAAAL